MECNNYGLCSALAAVTFYLNGNFLTGVLVHLDAEIYQKDETDSSQYGLHCSGKCKCVIASVGKYRYEKYAQKVLG